MSDNPFTETIWLIAGGCIAAWCRRRLEVYKAACQADERSRWRRRTRESLRARIVAEAFVGIGAWVGLLFLLDRLF